MQKYSDWLNEIGERLAFIFSIIPGATEASEESLEFIAAPIYIN
jgi:hypothetical protein